MIPLYFFALAWLIFLAVYVIISIFSIFQMMRYGLLHLATYATTIAFVVVSVAVILGTLGYLSKTDLKASVDFGVINAGLYAPDIEL